MPLRGAGVALLDGAEPALAAIRASAEQGRRLRDRVSVGGGEPRAARPRGLQRGMSAALDVSAVPGGWLDTASAFRLLASAGIPVVERELATSADGAVAAAERLGYPVALKVESGGIQHKTEVGGVELGMGGPAEVREAFGRILDSVAAVAPGVAIDGVTVERMAEPGIEVLLGVKRDPDFGPVVAVGLGGVFVEVFEDVAVALLPVTDTEAREMLRRLRSWPLFDGARGRPRADVDALIAAIQAVGNLADALGERVEAIDVNPLIVYPTGQGVLAVDALVWLR